MGRTRISTPEGNPHGGPAVTLWHKGSLSFGAEKRGKPRDLSFWGPEFLHVAKDGLWGQGIREGTER